MRVSAVVAIALALYGRHQIRAALRSVAPPDAASLAELLGTKAGPILTPEVDRDAELGVHWRAGGLRVVSTSPAGDSAYGYSGSTGLLLAFDAEGEVQSASIAWSDDTSEHVEVVRESRVLEKLLGRTSSVTSASSLDGVSGATLTARAIEGALARRFGGTPPSVFSAETRVGWPQAIESAATRRLGVQVRTRAPEPGSPFTYALVDAEGSRRGAVLSTSPAGDRVIGYSGPSAWTAVFDVEDALVGIELIETFDNEPYVGYVAAEPAFPRRWQGATLQHLATGQTKDGALLSAGMDGVSGATLTSMACISATQVAAERAIARPAIASGKARTWPAREGLSALALALAAGLLAASRRAGMRRGLRRRLRLVAQALLVAVLGTLGAHFVSLALLIGLAESGASASPLLLALAALALLWPLVRGRNAYCHDICPHGAVQQWLRRRRPGRPRSKRRARLVGVAVTLPTILVLGALTAAVLLGRVPASELEPFDAWSLGLAAPVSLAVLAFGLALSRSEPMVYCRFGCPTGALLGALHRRIPRTSSRADTAMTAAYAAVAVLAWLPWIA